MFLVSVSILVILLVPKIDKTEHRTILRVITTSVIVQKYSY